MKKLLVKVINETLWSKTKKLGLIKELGIDLENCEGCEIFEGKYTKKLYGNDLFLFINNSLVFNTMLSRIGNKLYRISSKSALKLHLTDIIL